MNTHRSLTDVAYDHLKGAIISGQIPAGAQVDAKEISSDLGVSRTPVREAILRLANEKIVEVTSRRGIRVLPLSVDDLYATYQVITALEVEAVFLLSAQADRSKGVQAVTQAIAEMDKTVKANDGEAWNLADEAFHRAILEYCGNPRLARAGLGFRDIAQRAHFVALRLVPISQKAASIDAHRELVDKIRQGDAYNARESHRTQRSRGAELLVAALRELRLAQL